MRTPRVEGQLADQMRLHSTSREVVLETMLRRHRKRFVETNELPMTLGFLPQRNHPESTERSSLLTWVYLHASQRATELAVTISIEATQRSLGVDIVFPNEPDEMGNIPELLVSWLNSGFSFIPVHPAGDRHNVGEAVRRIARPRTDILRRSDQYILADTVDDILLAKREDKLGVGLHVEGSGLLERDLNKGDIHSRPILWRSAKRLPTGRLTGIDIALPRQDTLSQDGLSLVS